jgi:hypothetical protein
MKNARFRVPNINRDALLAKFLRVADAQLPFRFEFDFELVIFLESADAKHAETYDPAVLAHSPHYRIAFSRPHVAGSVTERHFEVIGFGIKPQFHFIAHDISPTVQPIRASRCRPPCAALQINGTIPPIASSLIVIAKKSLFAVAVRSHGTPAVGTRRVRSTLAGGTGVGDSESTRG